VEFITSTHGGGGRKSTYCTITARQKSNATSVDWYKYHEFNSAETAGVKSNVANETFHFEDDESVNDVALSFSFVQSKTFPFYSMNGQFTEAFKSSKF